MPGPTSEIACTAAIDLPDVRCAATEHPHRGMHHRTGVLPDGTRWTVFWGTRGAPAIDDPAPGEQPLSVLEDDPAPGERPVPSRRPQRLRRTDYAQRVLVP